MSRESLDQDAGTRLARALTKDQRELCEHLWRQRMQPIAAVTRTCLASRGSTSAQDAEGRLTAGALVSAAGAMAMASERQQAAFIKHGLAPDFVASLRSAASALDAALK